MSHDKIYTLKLDILHTQTVQHWIQVSQFGANQPGEDQLNILENPAVKALVQEQEELKNLKGFKLLISSAFYMTKVLEILTVLLRLKYKIDRNRESKGVQPNKAAVLSKQTNVGSTSWSPHHLFLLTLPRKHIA